MLPKNTKWYRRLHMTTKVQTVIEYLDSFAEGSSIKLTGISVKESLYYVSGLPCDCCKQQKEELY